MKSTRSPRDHPVPGALDDQLPWRAIPLASRACCCPATPVVTVIMPPTADRRHSVDLLLCGHHYRASQAALSAAGASVFDRSGRPLAADAGRRPAAPDDSARRAGTRSRSETGDRPHA